MKSAAGECDWARKALAMETRSGKSIPPPTPPRKKYQTISQTITKLRKETDSKTTGQCQSCLSVSDTCENQQTNSKQRVCNSCTINSKIDDAISDARLLSEEPEDEWLCSDCNKDMRSEPKAIGCDKPGCNRWFHPTCLTGTSASYLNQSVWHCHHCTKVSVQSTPMSLPSKSQKVSSDCFDHIKWGELQGTNFIEELEKTYDLVVSWRRNVFKLPTGKNGKLFLKEMATLFEYFNSGSSLQPYALKLIMIFGPLLLQKPSKTSKSKDHCICLSQRLLLWQKGDLSSLSREGRAIQKRLTSSKKRDSDPTKIFTRLMLQGKVSAALKWVNSNKHGLLEPTSEVIHQLLQKHPNAADIEDGSVFEGPHQIPHEVTFHSIDSHAIFNAAKNTHGSSGPSGIDAEGWQRFLCSRSFGKETENLCSTIAEFTRKIASTQTNPNYLSAFTASRLIPLDKGDHNHSVRPIGVGEVLRRIVGKAIIQLLKFDVAQSTAPIQTCGGVKGGVEAAVHGLRSIWEESSTEAIILVDASNAFNCMNRKVGLQNTGILCPDLYTYLLNTYSTPSDLYVTGGNGLKIKSNEGTTQGDTAAMAFYALSLMKMIRSTQKEVPNVKQVYYADDGAGGGDLDTVKEFWKFLKSEGPKYGYLVNPSKTFLLVKPGLENAAKAKFSDINITLEGHKYLGSYIGTDEGKEKFVKEEVKRWTKDIEGLSSLAENEPHLAYSAYVYGTSKRWNYLMRTTPDISYHLQDIEETIRSKFIPSLIGHQINDNYRVLFSLPVRHGGMALENPSQIADREYHNSTKMTEYLWRAIQDQMTSINIKLIHNQQLIDIMKKRKEENIKQAKFEVMNNLTSEQSRYIALACEKGASSWLSALPLEQFGFALNKQEFVDAIALRYNFDIPGRSQTCVCGEINTQDHSLICKKGGFVSIRHNTIRDTTASLLEKVAYGVETEPRLLPVGNRTLPPGSNISDGARLDVAARGFWTPLDKAMFDIRVLHPGALSNNNKSLEKMYSDHEKEKKRMYNHRVIQIEHGQFTPLVFSTTGGMAKECSSFLKKLSEKLSQKTNRKYSDTVNFVRRRIRIELLKTCLIAIRGHRGRFFQRPINMEDLDINLIPDMK